MIFLSNQDLYFGIVSAVQAGLLMLVSETNILNCGGNIMSHWLSYVILIAGFALLTKGADFFVEGAAAVAGKLRVPSFIIGMTIVAMGTSAPECAVSVTAALKGSNQLAVSNAVGSNLFNLMVVCGFCSLAAPLAVETGVLRKEFPFSILVAVLLLAAGAFGMSLGRADGLILLAVFVIFLFWMIKSACISREKQSGDDTEGGEQKNLSVFRCVVYIAGGLAAIVLGGDWVVDGASIIAASFGMSQNLIGLTVVAFGTSLPELVTSFAAARKKQADMALGNVIGSNIFNILLILGLAAVISPMSFNMENLIDTGILTGLSIEVYFFCMKDHDIRRTEGIIMLAQYALYTLYICMR